MFIMGISFSLLSQSNSALNNLSTSTTSSQSSPTTMKDTGSVIQPIDLTAVNDPSLKEILKQVNEKLFSINDYYCVVNVSTLVKGGELAYTEEQCFKCPNLFLGKMTQTNHILADVKGSITISVFDGQYLWKLVKNASGSGKELAKRFEGKLPPAELEKMIKNHETPKIYKYNPIRLNQEGFSIDELISSAKLLTPFQNCDIKTLKLLSQTESVWVFSAKPNESYMEISQVQLIIDKTNGIIQKIQYFRSDGSVVSTETISNVRLNIGMEDSKFKFIPPAGIEIIDDTENIIQSLNRQKKQNY